MFSEESFEMRPSDLGLEEPSSSVNHLTTSPPAAIADNRTVSGRASMQQPILFVDVKISNSNENFKLEIF